MASNRKKQDEKHLKILRDLVSLPGNKECFDCSQRGPTYVNTTIGTFVCTKCSGMLRGLTPPHRVKSISMASFTPEEIESIRSKGNDYCKKVWLALYEPTNGHDLKNEQHIQDFMISKYEKKRYYMEPSPTIKNGNDVNTNCSAHGGTGEKNRKCLGCSFTQPKETDVRFSKAERVKLGSNNESWKLNSPFPEVQSQPSIAPPVRPPPIKAPSMSITATTNMFTPDRTETFKFPPVVDPFGLPASSSTSSSAQQSFANFDDNPIFSYAPQPTLPVSTSFPSALRQVRPPTEDKYAALKDLDCLMKLQNESHAPATTQGSDGNDWTEPSTSPSNPFVAHNGKNGFSTNLGTSPNNPFLAGFEQNAAPSPSPWGNMPSSHSMPFPSNWVSPNNLTVGPSKSNPFL